ncbi:carboxypeptidase-like regulatory domain-containing protein [Nocardia caishijiensis]|uniref:carboxypeptidase-like regulatory domain-containing protein n=1 Tax=Nocardia caishijiensis TaxID=184756 RepID=UPI0013313953|nr:carboxypeptidase-like regulatory domain-containing protein [Nocardia caishijiensis]
MIATALLTSTAGGAAAHPGAHDDTVGQTTTSCEQGGETLYHDRYTRAAVGQIDALLVEADTQAPVAGGKVMLVGVDACGDAIHRHLVTGTSGQASFRGLQPGRYQLTAYTRGSDAQPITSTEVALDTPSTKTVRFVAG